MANIISPKVNDKISHLMKLRREVLNDEGPNSKNFLNCDWYIPANPSKVLLTTRVIDRHIMPPPPL